MSTPYAAMRDNGVHKSVHRVMMERHIGRKLRSDEVVHHVNGNKRDNRIENLVIMTSGEHSRLHNQIYAKKAVCVVCGKEFYPHPTNRKSGKLCSITCKRNYYKHRPILQLNIEGELVKRWDSVREAERELNLSHGGINACCNGKQKSSHGYKWRYENE